MPQRTLYTGAQMPAIGLGTFGSDAVAGAEIAEAVRGGTTCLETKTGYGLTVAAEAEEP